MNTPPKTEFRPFPQEKVKHQGPQLPKPRVQPVDHNKVNPKRVSQQEVSLDESAIQAYKQQQAMQNLVDNITTPVSDGEYSSLELPSGFAFYKFKDLYVKPFKVYHLAKMARAHKESSLQPMIEVVSSVCYTTTKGYENGIAYQLTLPDFYVVLYWLRINSYTKTTYTHKTICNNPEHIKQVEEGIKPVESLRITEQIRFSKLDVKKLEEMPNPDLFLLSNHDVYLKPVTMMDTLEVLENPKLQDEEFQFLSELACYVQSTSKVLSLDERVTLVSEMSPDDSDLIQMYAKICSEYGVQEKVNIKCNGCGASIETKLSIDAHSFLSS